MISTSACLSVDLTMSVCVCISVPVCVSVCVYICACVRVCVRTCVHACRGLRWYVHGKYHGYCDRSDGNVPASFLVVASRCMWRERVGNGWDRGTDGVRGEGEGVSCSCSCSCSCSSRWLNLHRVPLTTKKANPPPSAILYFILYSYQPQRVCVWGGFRET